MKHFSVIQVMYDGTEERYFVTARNYRTCWRNRAEHSMRLERTRSIVIHEVGPADDDEPSEGEREIGRRYGIQL